MEEAEYWKCLLLPCKQSQESSTIPSFRYSHNPPPSCQALWLQKQSLPAPKGWRGGKHPQSSLGPVEASLFPRIPPIPIFLLPASDPVDKQIFCLQGPTMKVEHVSYSSPAESFTALKTKAKGSAAFSLLQPPLSVLPGETAMTHLTSTVVLFYPLHLACNQIHVITPKMNPRTR